jgi:hypothetical protein
VDGCIHSGTVSRETLSAIGVTVVVVPGGFGGVLNGEKRKREGNGRVDQIATWAIGIYSHDGMVDREGRDIKFTAM